MLSVHTKFLLFNLRGDPVIGSRSHSADAELKVESGSTGELVLRCMLDFRVSSRCVSNCCASMWAYSLNREIRRKERHLQGFCCAFTTEAVKVFFDWRVLCLPSLPRGPLHCFPQVFLILTQSAWILIKSQMELCILCFFFQRLIVKPAAFQNFKERNESCWLSIPS